MRRFLPGALIGVVFVLLVFISTTYAESDDLDKELNDLLLSHSAGQGIDYFKLPGSHQLNLIPQDPKNALSPVKIKLGKLLYHEVAMAVDNVRPEGFETYSCATCHFAQAGFMGNLPQSIGEGGVGFEYGEKIRVFNPTYIDGLWPDVQPIRTPTVLNGAYQHLSLWNGQLGGVGDNLPYADIWPAVNNLGLEGLETQAFAALATHRMQSFAILSRVPQIGQYHGLFRAAFPDDAGPINRLNAALAIAAFQRTVLANQSPWQKYLGGETNAMSDQQKRGAKIFVGKANCVACHTGPALSSMTFHAMGMDDLDASPDPRVFLEPFGGTVPEKARLGRGGFTEEVDDNYKFKTPQLYNLADSRFYGHGATFITLRAVVEYMNEAVPQKSIPTLSGQFKPLGLTEDEIDDLLEFLEEALHDPDLMRYVPERLPSGNCTPVNDPQAQSDLMDLGFCR
ncbi:MAG: c-type cytochrome [Planctomycetota bacterium]|nr:MAG: c-type cytochrome [Planctomycetota bacterium]